MKEALENLLRKASRLDENKSVYMTKEEWEELRLYDGIKKLKQVLGLGFFIRECTKTLEDFAKVLYEMGVASSLEESKLIIPLFSEKTLLYKPGEGLNFKEVENIEGKKGYRVTIGQYSFSG